MKPHNLSKALMNLSLLIEYLTHLLQVHMGHVISRFCVGCLGVDSTINVVECLQIACRDVPYCVFLSNYGANHICILFFNVHHIQSV